MFLLSYPSNQTLSGAEENLGGAEDTFGGYQEDRDFVWNTKAKQHRVFITKGTKGTERILGRTYENFGQSQKTFGRA